MPAWGYTVGTIAGVILIWHLAVVGFTIPPYLLPPPAAVAGYIALKWQFLIQHTWFTTYETICGFLLSIVIGIPLAILIVWSRVMDRIITPFLVLSQTFPKVAIAPLLIIWFGLGILPKILVSFLVAFFPIVIEGITGMRSVETEMMELIHSMQANQFQIFWKIRLPHSLPYVFGGLKVAIAFAIVGAVVGEWVGANQGLGYLLLWANANLDTPMLFSVLIVLMAIGVLLYYLIVWLERLIIPWHVSIRETGPRPTI